MLEALHGVSLCLEEDDRRVAPWHRLEGLPRLNRQNRPHSVVDVDGRHPLELVAAGKLGAVLVIPVRADELGALLHGLRVGLVGTLHHHRQGHLLALHLTVVAHACGERGLDPPTPPDGQARQGARRAVGVWEGIPRGVDGSRPADAR